ncbi:hypothetical protein [Winogradskyella sp.]|uniref:hypothetical protein n=1 Tax=Winogradskyella sp. TaxID=1883156 RepID=UPI00261FE03D|nr:hypothetical protein [Winogradskyella sp.]
MENQTKNRPISTFSQNPFVAARQFVNQKVFSIRLDKDIDESFRHKTFAERFRFANIAFKSLGYISQLASLVTAFTMLNYLFAETNVIARLVLSVFIVVAIELIKRSSVEDVMQGIFQYQYVEPFAGVLFAVTAAVSIYISVEGAKLLPHLIIADPVLTAVVEKSTTAVDQQYNQRISDLKTERETYRKNRLWKGRLASKDAKKVQYYNNLIIDLEREKQEAINAVIDQNNKAHQAALAQLEQDKITVVEKRSNLSTKFIIVACVFEVLLVLCCLGNWSYKSNCKKEKDGMASADSNASKNPASVAQKSSDVGQPGQANAIGFRKYGQRGTNNDTKTVNVEIKCTRVCPECGKGFVHRSHNHTYCSRECMLKARDKRLNKT